MGRDRTFEKKTKYVCMREGAVLKTVVHKTFCRVVIVVLQKNIGMASMAKNKVYHILAFE